MELRALLVPIGRHPHPAGTQVIDDDALQRIASAAKRRGQDIPVDFDHATAADAGATLAGHIAPSTLAVTPSGLRGVIVLNGRGTEALRAGAYRNLSPALLYNPRLSAGGDLHVERLVAVALTNRPNIPTMEPLAPIERQTKNNSSNMNFLPFSRGGAGGVENLPCIPSLQRRG